VSVEHYLVRMEYTEPVGMADTDLQRLQEAERRCAHELQHSGVLRQLWRVPGRRASLSVWAAPGATALHEALSSLPMWPWLTATVEALATHPNRLTDAE
jgi:muconolactone D-isomerase